MSDRLERLQRLLSGMESVLVAYSGGIDSTLLLYLAGQALGGRVLGATVRTPLMTEEEIERSRLQAAALGIRHVVLDLDVLGHREVASNPPQRCYHCKKAIFSLLQEEAARRGIPKVIDATQADDLCDFRPGLVALADLGIRSPLAEVGIGKKEVRHYAELFKLPGADRPASPCLATRVPFGTPLTPEALARVAAAEGALRGEGFPGTRVRDRYPVAVIEVLPGDIERIASWPVRERVVRALRQAGYNYVTVDLEGYRTGSLAETLPGHAERKMPDGRH